MACACVVALGSSATAVFSREDALVAELLEAGGAYRTLHALQAAGDEPVAVA